MTISFHNEILSAHNPNTFELSLYTYDTKTGLYNAEHHLLPLQVKVEMRSQVEGKDYTFTQTFSLKSKQDSYFFNLTSFLKTIANLPLNGDYVGTSLTTPIYLHLVTINISVFNEKKEKFREETYEYPVLNAMFYDFYSEKIHGNFRLATNQDFPYFKGYPCRHSFLVEERIQKNHIKAKIYTLSYESDFLVEDYYNTKTNTSRIVEECGLFLIWRNPYFGWSYWLFRPEYQEEIKTKHIGSMEVKSKYISRKNEPYSFGFTSSKKWTLNSYPILSEELEEVKTLFTSPEVYLWTKENNYQRVLIAEGTQKYEYNQHDSHQIQATIEFVNDINVTKI